MSTDISRRRILQMAAAPALLARQDLQVRDMAPTVSRVYPGTGGKLVYVPDDQGNVIHDASHAGYGGGGVAIPTVPIKETIWPVAGDNTANIQGAINNVAALPLDRNGFRGTVLLRAGYYRMATPVTINASGIVLRGEGMGDTGTILVGTGTGRPAVAPDGAPGAPAPVPAAPAGSAGRRPWWRAWRCRRPRRRAGPRRSAASAAAPPRSFASPGRPARCRETRPNRRCSTSTSRSADAASR